MRFVVPDALFERLRASRTSRGGSLYPDEIEHKAVCLDGGMGPVIYLTADGRILIDSSDWDSTAGLREATDAEALSGIVIGAKKLRAPELLDLLPPRPANADDCAGCRGSGWTELAGGRFVCRQCHGLGWVA